MEFSYAEYFIEILETLEQLYNVEEFYLRICNMKDLILECDPQKEEKYFIACLLQGLKSEIRVYVTHCGPIILNSAYKLALHREMELSTATHSSGVVSDDNILNVADNEHDEVVPKCEVAIPSVQMSSDMVHYFWESSASVPTAVAMCCQIVDDYIVKCALFQPVTQGFGSDVLQKAVRDKGDVEDMLETQRTYITATVSPITLVASGSGYNALSSVHNPIFSVVPSVCPSGIGFLKAAASVTSEDLVIPEVFRVDAITILSVITSDGENNIRDKGGTAAFVIVYNSVINVGFLVGTSRLVVGTVQTMPGSIPWRWIIESHCGHSCAEAYWQVLRGCKTQIVQGMLVFMYSGNCIMFDILNFPFVLCSRTKLLKPYCNLMESIYVGPLYFVHASAKKLGLHLQDDRASRSIIQLGSLGLQFHTSKPISAVWSAVSECYSIAILFALASLPITVRFIFCFDPGILWSNVYFYPGHCGTTYTLKFFAEGIFDDYWSFKVRHMFWSEVKDFHKFFAALPPGLNGIAYQIAIFAVIQIAQTARRSEFGTLALENILLVHWTGILVQLGSTSRGLHLELLSCGCELITLLPNY